VAATSNVASVAVALLCVLAFGMAGTSLESAVSTEPDEVIDVDYDEVPIGQERGETIKQSVSNDQNGEQTNPSSDRDGSSSENAKKSDGGETQPDTGGTDGERTVGYGEPSLLDRLLSLLRALLAVVLPVLAVVISAALLYRYRHRLAALLGILANDSGGAPDHSGDESTEPWGGAEPSSVVDWVWLDLVRRIDLDRPETKTPAEVQAAAVRSGMDSGAVETVTRTFRDVHYGDEELSDGRRQRVNRSAERLGLGGGSP